MKYFKAAGTKSTTMTANPANMNKFMYGSTKKKRKIMKKGK